LTRVYIDDYMGRQRKMPRSATGKINPALGFANHGADLAYRARFTINFCSRVRILHLGPKGRPLPSPVVYTPGSVQGRPFVTFCKCSYTGNPNATSPPPTRPHLSKSACWLRRAAFGTPSIQLADFGQVLPVGEVGTHRKLHSDWE
jgi:hypothetical protein